MNDDLMVPVVEDVDPDKDIDELEAELRLPVDVELDPRKGDSEYIDEDGEPLESDWHLWAMNLLTEVARYHHRRRQDYYVGGNMFVYYKDPKKPRKHRCRGPDFFFVWGRPFKPARRFWRVWDEDGKYPDVIIELLSPRTARIDLTTKKQIYEQVFRTHEYYCYDPDTEQLQGWRLDNQHYETILPDSQGRLWCEKLGLWLGTWKGTWQRREATWLRFFDKHGKVVRNLEEVAQSQRRRAATERRRAEEQRRRAEEQRRRAERAEKALAKLKAQVRKRTANGK